MLRKPYFAVLILGLAWSVSAADFSLAASPQEAEFRITNLLTIRVPKDAKRVRIWFAVPQQDANTAIQSFKVTTDLPVRYNSDSWGNRVGYAELSEPQREAGQISIQEDVDLVRSETHNKVDATATRQLTEQERAALSRFLQPTTYVVVNDQIKKLAASITDGETNPVLAMHKLYDWTYKNVNYWVKDPEHLKASPVGSSEYCLGSKTGNCTDINSLLSSLAIASGIPSRMVYGSLLKPTLNGADSDASYHCWVEFFAPRLGWIPVDASLANIYAEDIKLTDANKKLVELTTSTGYHGSDPSKIDYYFGNLDERRLVWSVGRDLVTLVRRPFD
jgi:transglutaminase-like putative cysteine protease